jgi:hypothetical protein
VKSGAFRNLPKLLSLHLDHNSIIRELEDVGKALVDF